MHNQLVRAASDQRGSTHVVRNPIVVDQWGETPPDIPAPPMGLVTRLVLEGTLGLSPEQVAALGEQGIVGFLREPVAA